MRILFIGDIFGEETVDLLERELINIKRQTNANIVIANAENACKGRGLSEKLYTKLMKSGVNMITLGNHAFSKSEIVDFMNDSNIVRPANLDTEYGYGYKILNYNGKTIAVVNMLGRIYNNQALDCPFKTMDKILATTKADYYFVDFHADATSEKLAFAHDFCQKVSAVVGTHTHVQTADERLISNMPYITDVGMSGPLNGIIGNTKDEIIKRFRTGVYHPAHVEQGAIQINAVVIDLNPIRNKIERIHLEY